MCRRVDTANNVSSLAVGIFMAKIYINSAGELRLMGWPETENVICNTCMQNVVKLILSCQEPRTQLHLPLLPSGFLVEDGWEKVLMMEAWNGSSLESYYHHHQKKIWENSAGLHPNKNPQLWAGNWASLPSLGRIQVRVATFSNSFLHWYQAYRMVIGKNLLPTREKSIEF